MADVMTPEQRSRVMSRNRGKDTSPELHLKQLLSAGGLEFEQHCPSLPGKPDFAFHAVKLAVFVDGDFWHGWRFPIWKHRLSEFWLDKIAKNRIRDRKNFQKLHRIGWKAMRIWEHQVEQNSLECVKRIVEIAGSVDWQAIQARHTELPQLKRRNRLPKP